MEKVKMTEITMLTALALATLISTGAIAAEAEANFRIPSDVAASARERCGKLTPWLNLQAGCMRNEKEGYDKMGFPAHQGEAVQYDRSAEERKAALPHHDPSAVSLCPPPYRLTRDGCR
jgi:hypothetical protein